MIKKPVEGKNIVIIGSGIGGLSAGIILSLSGYEVTIVEKNALAGGLMRSYRRSGIECPVGVHYVGALGHDEPLGRMFSLLGITVSDLFERLGQDGIIDRYIFDDFTFDLPVGVDAYEKQLRAVFPGDARAIDIIMKNLREIAGRMLDPHFLINQGDPFRDIEYFTASGEYWQRLNVSDRLRYVLSMPTLLIGVPPADCPVIFHDMILAGYLFSSWRLKEGGSEMADVFAGRFTELGGKLILNDGAEKIMLAAGHVAGLRLASEMIVPADAVIAAIHPKTLLTMLPPEALKSSFRERVAHLEETDGAVTVQVSVDASAHPAMNHNIYAIHVDEKNGSSGGIFYQLRRGNKEANLLSIIAQSAYAEWSKWEDTKSGRRGRDYEEKKMNMAYDLLEKAARTLGKIQNPKILDVFTPLTLRDYVNCPAGSCYGVMRSASQLLKIASVNNIPVPGLFLAGQNSVAPGVLGSILGSFHVASRIAGPELLIRKLALA